MPFYKDRVFWYIFSALAFVKAAAFICICFFHPLGEAVLAFPDSLTYVYPAQTFLQYGSMWEAVSAAPMLLRTPGYPFFLALVQLVFHNLTWAVALAQNLLSLALLIPVYLTARQLSGRTAARWAAGFCAVSVLYFSLSFAVLTEILCAFLLAWFVYFIIHFFAAPRTRDLFCSALFLAAAVYVRPAAYYFMFAAVITLACFCASGMVRFSAKKLLLAFVLPLAVLAGAWQARNTLTAGFNGFTTVGAYNLYIWNEDYLARKFNLTVPQAHDMLQRALPPGFDALPPAHQARIYKAMAAPLLRESFLYKLSRTPLWAGKTLFGANFVHFSRLLGAGPAEEPDGQMLNHSSAVHTDRLNGLFSKSLFALAAGQVFIVVLLGIGGFFPLWKMRRAETFFLALYCLYFWGIGSTFFGAYARFRAPFEFVLCITAGAGLAARRAKRKNKAD